MKKRVISRTELVLLQDRLYGLDTVFSCGREIKELNKVKNMSLGGFDSRSCRSWQADFFPINIPFIFYHQKVGGGL